MSSDIWEVDESLPLQIHEKIGALRERFEDVCQESQIPAIEEYLLEMDESHRGVLFRELFALELEYRAISGESLTADPFQHRFPQYANIISKVFAETRPSAVDAHERLDGFELLNVLGSGGFGTVYRARDTLLDREVALKVPHSRWIKTPEDIEAYLREAQIVASLDHPHIVPVYEAKKTDDGRFYVASKLIGGSSLRHRLDEARFSYEETADLIKAVAEALQCAHSKTLVHCDIKPANILIDVQGTPYVADFGLALRIADFGDVALQGGTPAYMSPEQAAGESHRVDPRSDIFSLGIVFYEMLTGQSPFTGSSAEEVMQRIRTSDPPHPRVFDSHVPHELERMCLKCLAKRRTDRYSNAGHLVDDIEQWQQASNGKLGTGDPSVSPVVPKGLASFDKNDADFFLELLPGPRDRDGLPDSVRFWKRRIEATEPEETFEIGLLYGPSGCGKSSLIKAGLLPRLDGRRVLTVYVESMGGDMECRLTRALRQACPELSAELDVTGSLAAIRRGEVNTGGRKVLIVLDQFEQWLHANRGQDRTALTQALRHSDGIRLQCLLMVRDEYWMPATRFMEQLEVELVQGKNFAAVDLFDAIHARKVLIQFGHAYGRLPPAPGQRTADQEQFLHLVVAEFADEAGRVVPVQLALWADMVKGKKWEPATIDAVGGVKGVGLKFLHETFTAANAPPRHRLHQKAARAALRALLPDRGTDIRAGMRSQTELTSACTYASGSRDFEELMRILNTETRLLTPVDPEGAFLDDDRDPNPEPRERYYQLTHDYLVPSLRQWMNLEDERSVSGRARLRLQKRCENWRGSMESHQLPAAWELIGIWLFTRKADWTSAQREMISKATSVHATRSMIVLGVLLLIGLAAGCYVTKAGSHVGDLLSAKAEAVPRKIRDLRWYRALALGDLQRIAHDETLGAVQRARALCAIAEYGEPEPSALVPLIDKEMPKGEAGNIIAALNHSKADAISHIEARARTAHAEQDWRTKARLATAALSLGHWTLAAEVLETNNRPDPIQRTVFIDDFSSWHGNLAELAGLVENCTHAGLCSGVSLAVGSISDRDVGDDTKRAWQRIWRGWYKSRPDGGTHSATRWALEQWSLSVPDDIVISKTPRDGFDWCHTPVGLILLRVRSGTVLAEAEGGRKPHTISVTHDFLMSDREIWVGLFQTFIAETEFDGDRPRSWPGASEQISPTDAHPVQNVSWDEAIMFCNWLSWREGRTACYRKTGPDSWDFNDRADGYHLPTRAQWEYACRSGTGTEYSFGDQTSWLRQYAVCNTPIAEKGGQRMCNGWGLFNMHGNVKEWVHNFRNERLAWYFCGGSWHDHADRARSRRCDCLRRSDAWGRRDDIGFRVVVSSAGHASHLGVPVP